MIGGDFTPLGFLLITNIDCHRTARIETTALGWVNRAGDLFPGWLFPLSDTSIFGGQVEI